MITADIKLTPGETAGASFGADGTACRYTVVFRPARALASRLHFTDRGVYIRWPGLGEELGYVTTDEEALAWYHRYVDAVQKLAREVLDGLVGMRYLPAEADNLTLTECAPDCYCGCGGMEVSLGAVITDASGDPLDLHITVAR